MSVVLVDSSVERSVRGGRRHAVTRATSRSLTAVLMVLAPVAVQVQAQVLMTRMTTAAILQRVTARCRTSQARPGVVTVPLSTVGTSRPWAKPARRAFQ